MKLILQLLDDESERAMARRVVQPVTLAEITLQSVEHGRLDDAIDPSQEFGVASG